MCCNICVSTLIFTALQFQHDGLALQKFGACSHLSVKVLHFSLNFRCEETQKSIVKSISLQQLEAERKSYYLMLRYHCGCGSIYTGACADLLPSQAPNLMSTNSPSFQPEPIIHSECYSIQDSIQASQSVLIRQPRHVGSRFLQACLESAKHSLFLFSLLADN